MSNDRTIPLFVPITIAGVFVLALTVMGAHCQRQLNRTEALTKAAAEFRKDAITRGFAQYDSKEGHWRWRDPDEIMQTFAFSGQISSVDAQVVKPEDMEMPALETPAPTKKFKK